MPIRQLDRAALKCEAKDLIRTARVSPIKMTLLLLVFSIRFRQYRRRGVSLHFSSASLSMRGKDLIRTQRGSSRCCFLPFRSR